MAPRPAEARGKPADGFGFNTAKNKVRNEVLWSLEQRQISGPKEGESVGGRRGSGVKGAIQLLITENSSEEIFCVVRGGEEGVLFVRSFDE